MLRVDKATVEALQGTAPGACRDDHKRLYSQLSSGRIFGTFGESEREEIWERVCAVSQDCLIPSLFTFFEDIKFLRSAAACIRRLMHLSKGNSVTKRLTQLFADSNQKTDQCVIQVSNTTYAEVPGNAVIRLDLGCRQLWLAAFREYRDLPAEPQKKNKLLAKSRKEADETVLFGIASLASRLGFVSEEICKILDRSPDRELARRALLTVRKPEHYIYDNLEQRIQQLVEVFDTAQERSMERDVKPVNRRQRTSPPTRCGMPLDLDHDYDRQFLFLPTMHKYFENHTVLTSLFVRRSIYFAFFGKDLAVDMGSIPSESAQSRGFKYTIITEPDERKGTNAQLHKLSQEEQEKKKTIESLAVEIRGKREKLESLKAQIAEREEQVEISHLIAELQPRLAELVAKEKGQLEKLEALNSMEQVQTKGLERLAETMKEQESRLNEMALEEQEQKSRLEELDRLAEKGRLERQEFPQVAEEIGASQAEQQREYEHSAEVEEDASHAEEVLALSTDRGPLEETMRVAKRRGRITQFQFRELLKADTSEPQLAVSRPIPLSLQ